MSLIQYVVVENGYWYVASRERDHSIPNVTISSKGIVNGLSTEVNDGADFGPDSYNPNATGSYEKPPYTETLGVQEAFNYVVENGTYETSILGTMYTILPIQFRNETFYLPKVTDVVFPLISEGAYAGWLPSIYIRGYASGFQTGTYLINYNIAFGASGVGQIGSGGLYIGFMTFLDSSLNFPTNFGANPNLIFDTIGAFQSTLMMSGGNIAQLTIKNYFAFGGASPIFINGGYGLTALNVTAKNGLYLANVNQIGGLALAETIGITAGKPILNLNTWEIDDNGGLGNVIVNNTAGGTTANAHFEVGTCILSAGTSSGYVNFFTSMLQSSYPNITGFDSGTLGTLNVYLHIAKLQLDAFVDFSIPSGSGIVIKALRIDEIINNSGQDTSTLMALIGSIQPTTPSVPASGTALQNTNPYAVNVSIWGGVVTKIEYTPGSGTAVEVGTTGPATVRLNQYDSITLTYTSVPSWTWTTL